MSQVFEPVAETPRPEHPTINGDGGNLLAVHLMGLLLTMVTLGIYRFWWRTNVRRYLWSAVSYKGDPFEYTGKGGELFVGFLIVLFLVVAPLSGLYFAGLWLTKSGHMVPGVALMATIYVGMFALYGAAVYRVMMYRLSRTKWRGIRAALGGSSIRYTGLYVLCLLLQIVTLGMATPYVAIRLNRYMLNNVWFGSGRLRFEGDWKPLFKYFVVAGLIRIVAIGMLIAAFYFITKGSPDEPGAPQDVDMVLKGAALMGIGLVVLLVAVLAMFWYRAALLRTIFAGLEFEGVRFSAHITGGRLCRFVVGNFLLLIITQYITYPWIQLRVLRLAAEVIHIHGEPDFAAINQNAAHVPKFGEGLGEAFL
jgi:uncharacterized membrane protein YjgN (DUF898 family)